MCLIFRISGSFQRTERKQVEVMWLQMALRGERMAASGGRGVKILPSMPRRRRLESEFRPLLRSHCDRRRQVPEIKMNNLKILA